MFIHFFLDQAKIKTNFIIITHCIHLIFIARYVLYIVRYIFYSNNSICQFLIF